MTTENSVLERALSDADPGRTPRDAVPDAKAIATRDRILRSTEAPKKRRRARALGWASGVVAVATAAVVAFAMITPQVAAVAGTPAPLDFEGESTVADIVEEAHTALATSEGPSEAVRTVRTASWGFAVEVGKKETKVVPKLSTLTWEPDGSGRMTIIAGVPYDPADAVANSTAEVTSSGEVVTDLIMEPGDFTTPWTTVPAADGADMSAMLRALGMPDDPTAFDVETAFTSALQQWTLTNAQHAELLSLLEEAGDGVALGTSTDRLGRPVAGIRVQSPDGAASDLILISRETGRIVGVERTVLIADEVFDAGAIISYEMWDVTEGTIE
ncbi:hypothetical protein [Microbacterium sp. TPD7012]|uniref:hypothetical protein n=2 Tax=Bacillati TaxID=1783272 RepID=UPI000D50CB25|nr:hypothetical protein [Microbacterium sp. TPD7012]PVE92073.1 hypothetical protein DC434_17790 [Microbacterium sp. TPD7012]